MTPRSAKAKGARLEKWVAAALNTIGIPARRQPGSGIYNGFAHDVLAEIAGETYLVECKSWRHGWRTGDSALGKADLLVIRRDRAEPCVYMPWAAFERLVAATRTKRESDDRPSFRQSYPNCDSGRSSDLGATPDRRAPAS